MEVSFTGDILSHGRCRRSWAYESHAGFNPYEQTQAMEGRLLHHAMEWLGRRLQADGVHATRSECASQLERIFRSLYAQGIRSAFRSKADLIGDVVGRLYDGDVPNSVVQTVLEGARHIEYEMRTVRQVVAGDYGGKSKLVLTGVVDLVTQLGSPLSYRRTWVWSGAALLDGHPEDLLTRAQPGDVEIWDYKGSRSSTRYVESYVKQLLTYANLYADRTGSAPARCVVYFVNEPDEDKRLLAIPIDGPRLEAALSWTFDEVREIADTISQFQLDPLSVSGGGSGGEITGELRQQCILCAQRFDCAEFVDHEPAGSRELDLRDVLKN